MTTPVTAIADEYDFVAVGSGTGGLVGALRAADRGLRTVVLEKSSLLGGVSAYSQGQLWVPDSDESRAAGHADSAEEGLQYLLRLGAGLSDRDLALAYTTGAREVMRYLTARHDVHLRLIEDFPDYYFPAFPTAKPTGRYLESVPLAGAELGALRPVLRTARHLPYRLSHRELARWGPTARSHTWPPEVEGPATEADLLCLGTGLAAYLVRAADRAGVALAVDAAVTGLGRVDGGAMLVELGGGRTITARGGVLLATGGYDWNGPLARSFEAQPAYASATPPSVTGDHIGMATALGAATRYYPKSLRLGLPLPGQVDDGRQLNQMVGAAALPHAVLVDGSGRRFADESFYPSIGYALRDIDGARLEHRHWPCWIVFDAQFRRRYRVGPVRPGDAFPDEWGVVQGGTVDELARRAGIDPTGLGQELARFNAMCRAGRDEDFARGERPWSRAAYGDAGIAGNPNLGTVQEPPLFALQPRLIGVGIPTVGLATDARGRVLRNDGAPVPRLYAAGNSSALAEVGAGYQSGVANTRAAVFAYHAADEAAIWLSSAGGRSS